MEKGEDPNMTQKKYRFSFLGNFMKMTVRPMGEHHVNQILDLLVFSVEFEEKYSPKQHSSAKPPAAE